jgi:hypothetical protein
MEFPEEVLTKNRKGQLEVRNLLARGVFVLYDYRDPISFKVVESGKKKLYLKSEDGSVQEFYIIPTKTEGRELLLKPKKEETIERKVWNNKKKQAEDLFL